MSHEAKVALVTGAARGIGLASTELFLEQGWRVVMVDRDAEELTSAAAALKGERALLALLVAGVAAKGGIIFHR